LLHKYFDDKELIINKLF